MTPAAAHPWQREFDALAHAPEADWLQQARSWMLQGELDAALAAFSEASRRFPDSVDACLGVAGVRWQRGERQDAEAVLRSRLATYPGDSAATFLLVQFLREQGRLHAAAEAMRRLFEHGSQDAETTIRAVEMLDDYALPQAAFAICETAIAAGTDDARLHAYAGMFATQLGRFDHARERYRHALDHHPDAVNWNIPLGLAGLQRYADAQHPDLTLFREILQRPALDQHTRVSTLFALGKAHDDLGQYAEAAATLRQANAGAHASSQWSRKRWKRSIDGRLAAPASAMSLPGPTDWTPIFIVGVPRSGTTLLAERLAAHAGVCNRGELGWLEVAALRLERTPHPPRAALEECAAFYAAQLRQDDETGARCFIDKQPMNLLRVDLIMQLWANARVLLCTRDARDTALSLWSQSFRDAAHDYACDFADIAAVIHGCRRLGAHWLARYPQSVRTVRYEELVSDPAATIAALLPWLGLSPSPAPATTRVGGDIRTASAWQARQPVHARSVGRWRHYAPYVPELLQLPEH
ncbi:sulfotransferase [Rhodanobacter sp. PCA2]|uniref:tetratricopeptide repeat-containing sulfotransferase family protein n=1 Tax=Rhodanobacter sp. PCA2 TaxID=2006117 RepID=UPI0015E65AB8|nr:sulfotransferase [Rhodanobacter sp. PCA2]MBA2080170.1 sulfotransferase [Rhodanobacter sp. PCA2]